MATGNFAWLNWINAYGAFGSVTTQRYEMIRFFSHAEKRNTADRWVRTEVGERCLR